METKRNILVVSSPEVFASANVIFGTLEETSRTQERTKVYCSLYTQGVSDRWMYCGEYTFEGSLNEVTNDIRHMVEIAYSKKKAILYKKSKDEAISDFADRRITDFADTDVEVFIQPNLSKGRKPEFLHTFVGPVHLDNRFGILYNNI